MASLVESEPELEEVSLLEEEELLPLFVLFEEPLPFLVGEFGLLVSLLLPSVALLVPQQLQPLRRLSVLLTQVIFCVRVLVKKDFSFWCLVWVEVCGSFVCKFARDKVVNKMLAQNRILRRRIVPCAFICYGFGTRDATVQIGGLSEFQCTVFLFLFLFGG